MVYSTLHFRNETVDPEERDMYHTSKINKSFPSGRPPVKTPRTLLIASGDHVTHHF
jgi:hypothetical protein